jgi:hypothetical protein
MKYKVGDRVRIKTWNQMKKEFGVQVYNPSYIDCTPSFIYPMEEFLESRSDRILIISSFFKDRDNLFYKMNEDGERWLWADYMIECIEEKHLKFLFDDEVRFLLMDFD